MCFDGETGCFVNVENAFTITCFMAQKAGCMDHGAMVKRRPSRLRPLMLRFLSAPVYAHKRVRRRRSLRVRNLSRNGQSPAITSEATYTPTSERAGSRSETRSPAQKPAHKDLERNGQSPAITLKATYAPVSNRAGSRSVLDKMFALFIKSGTMTMYQLIR